MPPSDSEAAEFSRLLKYYPESPELALLLQHERYAPEIGLYSGHVFPCGVAMRLPDFTLPPGTVQSEAKRPPNADIASRAAPEPCVYRMHVAVNTPGQTVPEVAYMLRLRYKLPHCAQAPLEKLLVEELDKQRREHVPVNALLPFSPGSDCSVLTDFFANSSVSSPARSQTQSLASASPQANDMPICLFYSRTSPESGSHASCSPAVAAAGFGSQNQEWRGAENLNSQEKNIEFSRAFECVVHAPVDGLVAALLLLQQRYSEAARDAYELELRTCNLANEAATAVPSSRLSGAAGNNTATPPHTPSPSLSSSFSSSLESGGARLGRVAKRLLTAPSVFSSSRQRTNSVQKAKSESGFTSSNINSSASTATATAPPFGSMDLNDNGGATSNKAFSAYATIGDSASARLLSLHAEMRKEYRSLIKCLSNVLTPSPSSFKNPFVMPKTPSWIRGGNSHSQELEQSAPLEFGTIALRALVMMYLCDPKEQGTQEYQKKFRSQSLNDPFHKRIAQEGQDAAALESDFSSRSARRNSFGSRNGGGGDRGEEEFPTCTTPIKIHPRHKSAPTSRRERRFAAVADFNSGTVSSAGLATSTSTSPEDKSTPSKSKLQYDADTENIPQPVFHDAKHDVTKNEENSSQGSAVNTLVKKIMEMGFSEGESNAALDLSKGEMENAISLLLEDMQKVRSHARMLAATSMLKSTSSQSLRAVSRDAMGSTESMVATNESSSCTSTPLASNKERAMALDFKETPLVRKISQVRNKVQQPQQLQQPQYKEIRFGPVEGSKRLRDWLIPGVNSHIKAGMNSSKDDSHASSRYKLPPSRELRTKSEAESSESSAARKFSINSVDVKIGSVVREETFDVFVGSQMKTPYLISTVLCPDGCAAWLAPSVVAGVSPGPEEHARMGQMAFDLFNKLRILVVPPGTLANFPWLRCPELIFESYEPDIKHDSSVNNKIVADFFDSEGTSSSSSADADIESQSNQTPLASLTRQIGIPESHDTVVVVRLTRHSNLANANTIAHLPSTNPDLLVRLMSQCPQSPAEFTLPTTLCSRSIESTSLIGALAHDLHDKKASSRPRRGTGASKTSDAQESAVAAQSRAERTQLHMRIEKVMKSVRAGMLARSRLLARSQQLQALACGEATSARAAAHVRFVCRTPAEWEITHRLILALFGATA